MPKVLANVGDLVSKFSAINQDIADLQALKLKLDIFQGVLFLLLAPTFHVLLARVPFFAGGKNGNTFGFVFCSTGV